MSRWVVHARTEFRARHGLTSYRGQPETSGLDLPCSVV